jgi:hypothetical protein
VDLSTRKEKEKIILNKTFRNDLNNRRYDTQHNDIQHNDIQHNDTQYKGLVGENQHN